MKLRFFFFYIIILLFHLPLPLLAQRPKSKIHPLILFNVAFAVVLIATLILWIIVWYRRKKKQC
jgi:hypothetical protein